MATSTAAPDIAALRAELDHVRWMVADWKQRKSPIVEKAVLETRLAAAEAAVANAIDRLPAEATPAQTTEHVAKHAARAAKIATTSTAKAAHSMLDHETNARFWAQTGYKPGQKLDTSIPADRAMAKVWSDIYAKVKSEDDRGQLVLTYNHPAVEQHLENAATAHGDAQASLELAATAEDPALVAKHEQDAANAHAASQSAAAQAGAMQPATVSPDVAHAAAVETAHMTAMPPPPPPRQLPPQHPAHAAPNARPHPTIQIQAPHPVWDVPRGYAPQPPASPSEFYATWQTQQVPDRADETHAIAAAVPTPRSTIDGGTIADIRAHGRELAAADASGWVATALMPDNSWQTSAMPSRDALDGWYGTITDHPDSFKYAAVWDKTDEANWPAGSPSNETFGSGKAIDVRVAVERPPAIVHTETKSNYGPAVAFGAVALAGTAAIFAGRKRTRRAR